MTCLPASFKFGLLRKPALFGAALLLASACLLVPVDASNRNDARHRSAVNHSMKVLDEFMQTFNRRDINAWARTLNFPHVRFASGQVKVWQTQEAFEAAPPFTALQRLGWDHSHWISREVVMSSADKVHIATVFERFNANNESIGVYESLYIVTRLNGRWGIQSRSSLAP